MRKKGYNWGAEHRLINTYRLLNQSKKTEMRHAQRMLAAASLCRISAENGLEKAVIE